ncbi:unnamed protein product, partial [marine sediment metagenome]
MCPSHSKSIPKEYKFKHKKAPDMSRKLLQDILDRYNKALRVWLVGTGEPILNPNFFDLVKECVKRKMIVNTFSNGFAIKNYKGKLVNCGLDRICISINGQNSEEFNRITGMPKDYYHIITENISSLVETRNEMNSKTKIELSFIIDQFNYLNIEQMIKVSGKFGIDSVSLNNFLPTPYVGLTPAERCLFENDSNIKGEIKRLKKLKFSCSVIWPKLLSDCLQDRKKCRWPFRMI